MEEAQRVQKGFSHNRRCSEEEGRTAHNVTSRYKLRTSKHVTNKDREGGAYTGCKSGHADVSQSNQKENTGF